MKKKIIIWWRNTYPITETTEIKCDESDLQRVLNALACNVNMAISKIVIEDLDKEIEVEKND